jgi:hypothetical protein
MEKMDKRSIEIIVDDVVRSLQILLRHIDETLLSYLTKTRKMINYYLICEFL